MRLTNAGFGLLVFTYFAAQAIALPIRTIAFSGDPAPGTPAGVYFTGFNHAIINENGVVAFNAFVGGPGVIHTHPSNAYGIWKGDPGTLTKVVRSAEQAVDLPSGTNYYLPGVHGIDGQGRVVVLTEAPGASVHGIFSEGQGLLRLVARETNQVPGQPVGARFDLFSLVPLMNSAGNTAFTSFFDGGGVPSFTEGLFFLTVRARCNW